MAFDPPESPMSLAEFDECCGRRHWDMVLGDHGAELANHCENCPALIERRREALRSARAH